MSKRFIFWAVFLVLSIEILFGLLVYSGMESWAERGTFGDMFGAVNTLFSGLAFAGVIYAILMQKEELSLQRQELSDTRAELKRSADIQREHADSLQLEASKNQLYRMVRHVDSTVEERLNQNIDICIQTVDSDFRANLRQLLFDEIMARSADAIPKEGDLASHASKLGNHNLAVNVNTLMGQIFEVYSDMQLLGTYLDSYEAKTGSNVLSLYYVKKYRVPVKLFSEKGYKLNRFWVDSVLAKAVKA